jgi:hypothetical protein
MREEQVRDIIQKLQDTYEAGVPVIAEFQTRWQDEAGLLHAIVFMMSVADMPVEQKTIYKSTLQQIIQDMDALFACLMSYHGLTLAVKSILQDHGLEHGT